MKFSLFVTQDCNLRCSYCYIEKKPKKMSVQTAEKAIDFVFNKSKWFDETINIGWFGGEPLLEFERIRQFTKMVKNHNNYDEDKVVISIVSNGTIFNEEIAGFINENGIIYGVSCDGPPYIQNKSRRFKDGKVSSEVVEKNIIKASKLLGHIMVNAVFTPDTVKNLPDTIRYFSGLGVRQIYLSPDYSSYWDKDAIEILTKVYNEIGDLYKNYYKNRNPHYINLIDNKISVILRNGYDPKDRCRMGKAEFAITTDGKIFPCERLVGSGDNEHQIGDIFKGIDINKMLCHHAPGKKINTECLTCGVKDYCMNWCGCSNFMTSGYYNRGSSFLCHSEQSILKTSFRVFQELEEEMGPVFYKHMVGHEMTNTV